MLLQSWVEGRSAAPVRGLRLHDLALDEAYLNVTNLLQTPAWLYTVKDACYKCPYGLVTELVPGESTVLKVSTIFSIKTRVLKKNLGDLVSSSNRSALECSVDSAWHFGEFGVYDLVVQPGKCSTDTHYIPVNIYLSCLSVTAIVIFFSLAYFFLDGIRKLWSHHEQVFDNTNGSIEVKIRAKKEENFSNKKPRVKSLDVFRGFSVIPLIFYCHKAGGYQVLEHATWDGLPIADWFFPWFLWIMGVCIPIGVKNSLERAQSRWQILKTIIMRSLVLFALGIMTNCVSYGGLAYESIRFASVLQRFALMCLINAGLCAYLWPRDAVSTKGPFADLRVLWPQWLLHLLLQSATLALVFLLPVPGCPTGYLGPGGLSEDLKYFNCTGGTFGYVNKLLQSEAHFLQDPTTKAVYGVKAFEPEGIFSNLPSLVTMILGVQAGTTMIMFDNCRARIKRWSIWGCGCILMGTVLHLTAIPINKQLWSMSFALVTGGGAFLGLTLFYFLVDVKKWWRGFPFLEPGVNCLAMYVGSRMTANLWPWHWSIGPMDTHFVLLLDSVWACALWLWTARWLFRRQIYVSV